MAFLTKLPRLGLRSLARHSSLQRQAIWKQDRGWDWTLTLAHVAQIGAVIAPREVGFANCEGGRARPRAC